MIYWRKSQNWYRYMFKSCGRRALMDMIRHFAQWVLLSRRLLSAALTRSMRRKWRFERLETFTPRHFLILRALTDGQNFGPKVEEGRATPIMYRWLSDNEQVSPSTWRANA